LKAGTGWVRVVKGRGERFGFGRQREMWRIVLVWELVLDFVKKRKNACRSVGYLPISNADKPRAPR